MNYKSSEVGNQIVCILHGVPDHLLNNPGYIRDSIRRALEEEKFTVLKIDEHEFNPQGYTSLVLLAESHLAVHTYPEHKSMTVDLYSCRGPKDGRKTIKSLTKAMKPEKIKQIEHTVKLTDE
jgi:S-adenosylmethionine decarboxylase